MEVHTPSKNSIFKNKFHYFLKNNFKTWLIQKIAMLNIFYLVYSLCFYGQNQLNYKQFSKGSKNAEKPLVLKGLKYVILAQSNPIYVLTSTNNLS